jgi:hypothetical protein
LEEEAAALLQMDLIHQIISLEMVPLVDREVVVEISMDSVLTEPPDKGIKVETNLATFQVAVAAVAAVVPVPLVLMQ